MRSEQNNIVIFESTDKTISVDVQFDRETVWLTLDQMAMLFERDKSTISRHIKNVFAEDELSRAAVVANFATTAADGKTYQVDHYDLDVIISVGYRVKSLRGTQFRQWANSVLRQHLLQGYTVNRNRLKQLNQMVDIISRSITPEIAGISGVLRQFTGGLDLLDRYDHHTVIKPKGKHGDWQLTYDEARAFIDSMKFGAESSLFGHERDESFKGSLGAIYQTFGEQELYSSVQEKAANLLYFIVKNHSFSDGNKRIAAALFVYFLDKNGTLRDTDGRLFIDNNTLAAATLMIALSRPEEKDIMCALVMNMLDGKDEDGKA